MTATLKAQKTISSWQINTASYDEIDIIKYHGVLQGMLTKKGVVFHLAGKNKYTWAFKHQQNTGSIYEFCRISQVHFGNPSWSIIRTIRYLLDITFRSSPMMHFMYSPKSSRNIITVWTVCTAVRGRGESPKVKETWQHARCCLWQISEAFLYFLFWRRRHDMTHVVGKANTMPALLWKVVFAKVLVDCG